jgi:hypothetical protein
MTAEDVRGVYTYGNSDPVLNEDPLGLKPCGPVPAATGKCAADCYARYQWGLCRLKEAKQGKLVIGLAFAAVGVVKGYATGNLRGACLGAGLGFASGYAAGKLFYGPLTDGAVRQGYADCNRNCEAEKCEAGPCRGFFGGLGGVPTGGLQ